MKKTTSASNEVPKNIIYLQDEKKTRCYLTRMSDKEIRDLDTKIKRLEKIKPMIMDGIGFNDKYR